MSADAIPTAPPSAPRSFGPAVATLAAVLAFLAASVPARQADLWLHLAAGRQVLAGNLAGPDPFAYTAPPRAFAPGFVGDLLLYLGVTALGDAVVIASALLAACLAFAMVWAGTERGRSSLAAPAALLGVLASAPWLALSPALFSPLLLAVGVGLAEAYRGPRPPGVAAFAAVLAASFLLDGDFVLLAPALALYLLGEGLGRGGRVAGGGPLRFAVLPAAGIAIVGLWLWRGQLPPTADIFNRGSAWAGESLWRGQHLSILEAGYWRPGAGLSAAGVAFVTLVLAGAISFLLNRSARPWGRLFAWAFLLAVSLWHARATPLFAAVAAPILALNLSELLSVRPAALSLRGMASAGRTLAVVAGLAACVAAWPGWLLSQTDEPRRWRLEPDPSLRRAAEWFRDRRAGHGLPGRTLNVWPEAGAYLAWFAPGELAFVDPRFGRFGPDVVADLNAVRGALAGKVDPEQAREVFRRRGVTQLLLADPNPDRFGSALFGLLERPGEWQLLALDGRAAVVGWTDPASPDTRPDFGPGYDLERAAYAPTTADAAPPGGPPRNPQPVRWLDLLVPGPASHFDRDHARTHLQWFEASVPTRESDLVRAWLAHQAAGATAGLGWAGAVPGEVLRLAEIESALRGLSAPGERPPAAATLLAWRTQTGLSGADAGPPAALLVAARSARRATAADPDDALSWQFAGESARMALRGTAERAWARRWSPAAQLRFAQATTAFNNAAVLNPDLLRAHAVLVGLYQEAGAVDLALEHLQEQRRLVKAAGKAAGETAEAFRTRIDGLNEAVNTLTVRVENQREVAKRNSGSLRLADRAGLAQNAGLAGDALKLLLGSDYAAFGDEGMRLEYELLLTVGRAQDVLDWLRPEHEQPLTPEGYHWLRCRACAAVGDYAGADRELAELLRGSGPPLPAGARRADPPAAGPARAVAVSGGVDGSPLRAWEAAMAVFDGLRLLQSEGLERQRAELLTLRGVLSLEAGKPAEAEEHFVAALALWRDGAGIDFAGRHVALANLEHIRAAR